MASDRDPVTIPATPNVQGSQTTGLGRNGKSGRNPTAAKPTAAAEAAAKTATRVPAAVGTHAAAGATATVSIPATPAASTKVSSTNESPGGVQPQALVNLLNKQLNDSGRPDEFRVAPDSGAALIQQINPDNGAVVGQFSASEFPALARSVGAAGVLIDGFA